jgi:YesN/AraC family two-component response regulator
MSFSSSLRRPLVVVVEDEARNADEAMELLNIHNGADVLFTDIDMPGSMNGLDLAAAAKARWPSIEILLVSGHVKIVKDHLPRGSVFLSKPYDQSRISEHLKSLSI